MHAISDKIDISIISSFCDSHLLQTLAETAICSACKYRITAGSCNFFKWKQDDGASSDA